MRHKDRQMELAMVNNRVLPIGQALINAHDRGLFFGDGVYEVVRVYNRHPYRIDKHMARLERSAKEIMMRPLDTEVIERRIRAIIRQSQLDNALVYLHITRGLELRRHGWADEIEPQFFMTIRNRQRQEDLATEGLTAITTPDVRWKRCDIKTLNLLPNVLAGRKATQQGAAEAILYTEDHLVTEGSHTNVFAVIDDTIRTAALTSNILAGVTREAILELAQTLGLAVDETAFTVEEMCNAQEVFITGTSSEIRGLTRIDQQTIGSGQVGMVTAQLAGAFIEETNFDIPPEMNHEAPAALTPHNSNAGAHMSTQTS